MRVEWRRGREGYIAETWVKGASCSETCDDDDLAAWTGPVVIEIVVVQFECLGRQRCKGDTGDEFLLGSLVFVPILHGRFAFRYARRLQRNGEMCVSPLQGRYIPVSQAIQDVGPRQQGLEWVGLLEERTSREKRNGNERLTT